MSEKFKNSWDYIREANSKYTSKYFDYGEKLSPWNHRPIGQKWKDKDGWWVRVEDSEDITGRKALADDDPILQPAIPLFCPKCKRIMKRADDNRTYMLRGHCLLCDIELLASKNIRPNKHIIIEAIQQTLKDEANKSNDG